MLVTRRRASVGWARDWPGWTTDWSPGARAALRGYMEAGSGTTGKETWESVAAAVEAELCKPAENRMTAPWLGGGDERCPYCVGACTAAEPRECWAPDPEPGKEDA